MLGVSQNISASDLVLKKILMGASAVGPQKYFCEWDRCFIR